MNSKYNWNVYCHTNKKNNKKYIGITCKEPHKRWANGNGYKGQRFYTAIQKYGWDCFKHDILFENLTLEDANKKEIELIKKYDTTNRNNGYNSSFGGDGYCGFKISEESKDKMRISAYRPIVQLQENGDFVKDWDGVLLASNYYGVSSTVITSCCKGKKKTCKGFRWLYKEDYYSMSEKEIKDKVSKDRIRGGCKRIVQLDINGLFINYFNSNMDAQRNTGINNSQISNCCLGKTKTAHGFIWMYEEEYKKLTDYDKTNISHKAKTRGNRIEVVQLDRKGNFIQEFTSATLAGKSVGVHNSCILACCKNKTKTIKVYVWLYKYDYTKYLENKEMYKIIKDRNKAESMVVQLDKGGNLIKIWKNATEAEKHCNSVFDASAIGQCCRGKYIFHKGYKWMYLDEYKNKSKEDILSICSVEIVNNLKTVIQLDLDGKFIKKWDGIKYAVEELNVRRSGIWACCCGQRSKAGGFKWMYYEDYKKLSDNFILDKNA